METCNANETLKRITTRRHFLSNDILNSFKSKPNKIKTTGLAQFDGLTEYAGQFNLKSFIVIYCRVQPLEMLSYRI